MFLPAMRPREIAGQRLSIRGTYLGCAVVNTDSGPLAGLLFRDTGDIYICHAEPAGDDSAMVVTNVGDRASSEIKDFRSTVEALMERLEQNSQALRMKDAAIHLLQEANRELGELADGHATQLERQNEEIANRKKFLVELASLADSQRGEIEILQADLKKAELTVYRYETLVGPLETDPLPPPVVNAVFDFFDGPPPVPGQPPITDPSPADFGETAELPKKEWSATNPQPVDSDLL